MNCDDVQAKLGDFLDKEMLAELCREIESHLKVCDGCTVEVNTIQKTILLHQAATNRTIEVPLRVSQRLEQALAKEYGKPGASGTD